LSTNGFSPHEHHKKIKKDVSKVRTTIFGQIIHGVTTKHRPCLCPHKQIMRVKY